MASANLHSVDIEIQWSNWSEEIMNIWISKQFWKEFRVEIFDLDQLRWPLQNLSFTLLSCSDENANKICFLKFHHPSNPTLDPVQDPNQQISVSRGTDEASSWSKEQDWVQDSSFEISKNHLKFEKIALWYRLGQDDSLESCDWID